MQVDILTQACYFLDVLILLSKTVLTFKLYLNFTFSVSFGALHTRWNTWRSLLKTKQNVFLGLGPVKMYTWAALSLHF